MTLRWTADQDEAGLLAIVLENAALRVTVLPEVGGKIWSIVSKRRGREMLWHHPRLEPGPVLPGTAFDDAFCGGWDEVFPNDSPVTVAGVSLPDHGEWWSLPWAWRVDAAPAAITLTLTGRGAVTSHEAVRTITLREDRAAIALTTRIHNHGQWPLPYLWRQHPAFPVPAGARIELPSARVLVDAEFSPGLAAEPFLWPVARSLAGAAIDLSVMPPCASGAMWLLYATELAAGWCAIAYPEEEIGIRLEFDTQAIDTVTMFATCGGWRGLATVLLEPGIGYPYDLNQARAGGTCGVLSPGETVEFALTAVVYEDLATSRQMRVKGGGG